MVQSGRLEDYKGPYSPYVGKDTFVLNNTIALTGDNCCIHLYLSCMQSFGAWYSLTNFNITSLYQILTSMDLGPVLRKTGCPSKNIRIYP